MVYIACERLIFLTPSIEKIIASNILQQLCFSRISQTRSYLKCCYTSLNNFLKDTNYSKGYRHRTACLDVKWFGKMVYISEYDNDFFEMRKNDITTDIEKMHRFSIKQTHLDLNHFCPPDFISFNNGIPELKVHKADKELSPLECDWIVLSSREARTCAVLKS